MIPLFLLLNIESKSPQLSSILDYDCCFFLNGFGLYYNIKYIKEPNVPR